MTDGSGQDLRHSIEQDRRWLVVELSAGSVFFVLWMSATVAALGDGPAGIRLARAALAAMGTLVWCGVMMVWTFWRFGAAGRVGWPSLLAIGGLTGMVLFEVCVVVWCCFHGESSPMDVVRRFAAQGDFRPAGLRGLGLGLWGALLWQMPVRRSGRFRRAR